MTIKKKLFIFKIFLINIFISFSFFSFGQYTETDIYTYIDKYKEIALKKMQEYKIPASITLAQGIFESACGTSKLATMGNNHFGIKNRRGQRIFTFVLAVLRRAPVRACAAGLRIAALIGSSIPG